MSELSTLCYLEKDNKYLMMHRVVKKNDVNKDKWIGVGGHFEADESPEECLLREVKEETGYTLTHYRYRGIVTFVSGNGVTEYMSLFTADGFNGKAIDCDEGILEWVDKKDVLNLNIWEGDKIFFRLLEDDSPFFSLKLVYNGQDKLKEAILNGKPMELFDIINEDGSKTGIARERTVAHRDGSLHATVHIWFLNDKGELLLQKRSAHKDSNPGCYDISSAGHISSGDEVLPSAVREAKEELGVNISEADLMPLGVHRNFSKKEFYGHPFLDNEYSYVFLCRKSIDINTLHLQKEEVESVKWMNIDEVIQHVKNNDISHCIHLEELYMIKESC